MEVRPVDRGTRLRRHRRRLEVRILVVDHPDVLARRPVDVAHPAAHKGMPPLAVVDVNPQPAHEVLGEQQDVLASRDVVGVELGARQPLLEVIVPAADEPTAAKVLNSIQ